MDNERIVFLVDGMPNVRFLREIISRKISRIVEIKVNEYLVPLTFMWAIRRDISLSECKIEYLAQKYSLTISIVTTIRSIPPEAFLGL